MRESEHKWGRNRESRRQNPKQSPYCQHRAQLGPRSHKPQIMTWAWAKIKGPMLNQLSHPDTPTAITFNHSCWCKEESKIFLVPIPKIYSWRKKTRVLSICWELGRVIPYFTNILPLHSTCKWWKRMKDCKFLVLLNDCLYSLVLFREVKLLDPYSESRVKILTYIQNYFTYRMKGSWR